MKTLLLIDANSIIHRAFHALPPFTGPDGRPTGALYGISAMMLNLWRDSRPDYVAALFDRPEPTFRDAKYKEYKAQRPPTANELISQIIEARKLFESFGVTVFEKAGYEADDLIATLAEKFKGAKDPVTGENIQVVILTGDRDTLQMVEGERLVVKLFNRGVSDTTIYDEKAVEEKYGLRPNQLIDYKALVGDSSDNIKGVPGVGPKTAQELIKKFGTIEKMFAALPGDEKLEKRIGPFRAEAELSKELVTLERHAPVDIEDGPAGLEILALRENNAAIAEYFKTLGSATLLKRLAAIDGHPEPEETPKKAKPAKKIQQAGLF